jgi:hypothetical protein
MDWKGYQEEEDIKEAEKFYGRNKLVYNIAVSTFKYKINEFYFGTNTKSTNLQIHELVIFNQTTKIDTHKEKYFHSITVKLV